MDVHTLLDLKWITSKDLRSSTGDSAVSWGSLDGTGLQRRTDACMCMAESLCSSPGTITTLLISSTPIQNKRFKKMNLQEN